MTPRLDQIILLLILLLSGGSSTLQHCQLSIKPHQNIIFSYEKYFRYQRNELTVWTKLKQSGS